MNTGTCNCHSQTAKTSLNERPRYYARQLVTPDDLTLEQDYFRAKLRRHNRYLHGWGVVCGAQVVEAKQPWKVIVKTGYILGPYGDEIYIETDQCVDVRKKCMSPDLPDDDNECDEAQAPPPDFEATHYLAIRYLETPTRLIRVPLGGCGCEDNGCEHSRVLDHYQIGVIDRCPGAREKPPGRGVSGPVPPGQVNPHERQAPECPECSTEPWVVLSAFTVDGEGKVKLQLCECRRHVNSYGNYWWACAMVQPAGV